jgi:class 3 adenylate cyclase
MQCPLCSRNNQEGNNFCVGCGAQLLTHCSACGHRGEAGWDYCGACGAALVDIRRRGRPRPIAYPPAALAAEIDASRPSFRSGRKLVTVLFADVVGSSALIGDDPEIGHDKIDRALAVMFEAIHDARGFIARIQGDGVMALFGAPLAQEHHALRACDAALAIQRGIESLAGQGLRVRVGLNSGEVVVRTIRNDLSVDYDAVGQTVHLASRMEQMAEPGGILLTGNTLKLVQGFVAAETCGRLEVAGFTDKVAVHALRGRRQVRTRWEAAHKTRTLSAFVGRGREVGLLGEALAALRDGQAQVVHILGDAGVGKSRLVYEFLRTLEDAEVDVHVTGALRETRSTPYRPIAFMLRDWAGFDDRDDEDAAAAKLRRFFSRFCSGLDPDWPALRTILGLAPSEDEEWAQLDPHLRRRRMLDSIRNLMLARARTRPQVLIVEDAHWLDHESLAALDHLSLAMARSAILLVVTARFAQEPAWKPKAGATVVLLNPLGRCGAGSLLEHLLGDDVTLTQLKWRLLADTEGTPMFLEQMVEALVEEGLLKGEPGSYRFEGSPSQLRIPENIQSVIAARIDRLPETERRLLQVASVIGRAFPQTLLAEVSNLSAEELARSVIMLRGTGFLHDTMDGSGRLAFTHALIQEVAYNRMLKQQRRELHAEVLRLLEAQSDGEARIEDWRAKPSWAASGRRRSTSPGRPAPTPTPIPHTTKPRSSSRWRSPRPSNSTTGRRAGAGGPRLTLP